MARLVKKVVTEETYTVDEDADLDAEEVEDEKDEKDDEEERERRPRRRT